jgi:hypothetical protein
MVLYAAGAVALAAFLYWRFGTDGGRGAAFTFTVLKDGTVDLQGTVLGKSEDATRTFIEGLELPAGAKVWGERDGGTLRLRFSSHVPDNLRQRTRNFFGNP